jgi:hypothetical protein
LGIIIPVMLILENSGGFPFMESGGIRYRDRKEFNMFWRRCNGIYS